MRLYLPHLEVLLIKDLAIVSSQVEQSAYVDGSIDAYILAEELFTVFLRFGFDAIDIGDIHIEFLQGLLYLLGNLLLLLYVYQIFLLVDQLRCVFMPPLQV